MLIGQSAFKEFAVDDDSWSGANASILGLEKFVFNQINMLAGIETIIKGALVEPYSCGKGFKGIVAESAQVFTTLIGEQCVVILPELALITGAFRGFGRPDRFRAQESKMLIFEAN